MKTKTKYSNKEIELTLWQLFAIIIAAIACLIAIVPCISYYQSMKCNPINIENIPEPPSSDVELSSDYHKRYVRDVDQCDIIPPMCSSTTTVTTASTTTPATTTTRTTVSTVSVTRPVITTFSTTPRTTTLDPWTNRTRPYNSWRLPTFAKPIDYTLHISCPDCFILISDSSPIIFNGQVTIRIDILNSTEYLILHSKNLNIIQVKIINGDSKTANITYLPEYEMIYLYFDSSPIPIGEISLFINYTGIINQEDQTGFYRELFWKSIGEISYILSANFQPIYARQAFPCFDEPHLQSRFILSIEHPINSTIALSNNIFASQNDSMTTFEITPILSTYSLAWAILPLDEFKLITQEFTNITVNIWIRPELIGESNINLNSTFEIIKNTFEFIEDYLNICTENFPTKFDFIGLPDLILDEKASSSWGFLIFREEFLSIDQSLNSAERIQTTTKIIVEHILQIWFAKTNWWDNIWFDKSLSSYLAYKMIEIYYPSYKLMEQFSIREMVPYMIDDFKPNAWLISNKNLTNNQQILDYLSINIYSKSISLIRLFEHIVGNEEFQLAIRDILLINDTSNILERFYSNFNTILNTNLTVEEFFNSWLEKRNYPIVTIEFIPKNETYKNTTIIFRQKHFSSLFELNQYSIWNIYIECDLGGLKEENNLNLTANYVSSKIKFIFNSSYHIIELINEEYLWIKCNKNFYSYYITEYILNGEDIYGLYKFLRSLYNQNILSNNDKANLLNDLFILPYNRQTFNYDQTLSFLRGMFNNPIENYLSWSVFIWHWNYLLKIEEQSKYYWNFKQFATRQILAPFDLDINNIITTGTDHQERLLKSMLYELLCRIQNTDALTKSTDLYRLIPLNYFSNSSNITNIGADYLSTVIYYHIQNVNYIEEWDYLWINLTENRYITSQQRNVFLRALGAAKEIWRLKSLLEKASDKNSRLIKTQEFFDLIISISQNPNGRDILWNFYRQNYESFLLRFGQTNRLFNQLILNIIQSFENNYYYNQIINFHNQYLISLQYKELALEQVRMNIIWLNDGLAEELDNAISSGE